MIASSGAGPSYSLNGACTKQAESYFSELRRGEMGNHTWREDNRRVSNGAQVKRVEAVALGRSKSVDFAGYLERHRKPADATA